MIEALHRNNDALNRREFDVAIALAAPDIVLMRPGGLPPVHGIDAVRAWMSQMHSSRNSSSCSAPRLLEGGC